MKYTQKVKLKDGSFSYRFSPPKDVMLAGIVKGKTFKDGREARHEIPKLIQLVEDFRKGKILSGNINVNSNFNQVIKHFYNTGQFNSLSNNTRKNYEYSFKVICNTKIFSRNLGEISLKYVDAANCTEIYDGWARNLSVNSANHHSRVFSVLMNYCISIGLIDKNPMKQVKKRKHEPDTTIWTRDEVNLFLETAFSQWKWRNVGLLAKMCYDWGQRPTDIVHLEWDNIDSHVTIKQSKRGATVKLPIQDNLKDLLLQQQKDWSFQKYVIPHQNPSDGCYRPMSRVQYSTLCNEVKSVCGLPSSLKIGLLRKTAINEMIENNVDHLSIMSVTGHQNIQSLNPYNKHRLETATAALSMRRSA